MYQDSHWKTDGLFWISHPDHFDFCTRKIPLNMSLRLQLNRNIPCISAVANNKILTSFNLLYVCFILLCQFFKASSNHRRGFKLKTLLTMANRKKCDLVQNFSNTQIKDSNKKCRTNLLLTSASTVHPFLKKDIT